MEIATLIITGLVSSTAVLISIISLMLTKRQVITGVITKNRIEWINNVREHLMDFLEEYINEADKIKLRVIKSKIEMHIRNDAIYKTLINNLSKCIDNLYNEADYGELVAEAQIVLNKSWHRTKREAGIKKKEEKKLKKHLS